MSMQTLTDLADQVMAAPDDVGMILIITVLDVGYVHTIFGFNSNLGIIKGIMTYTRYQRIVYQLLQYLLLQCSGSSNSNS